MLLKNDGKRCPDFPGNGLMIINLLQEAIGTKRLGQSYYGY